MLSFSVRLCMGPLRGSEVVRLAARAYARIRTHTHTRESSH